MSSYVFKISTQEPLKLLEAVTSALGEDSRIARQVKEQMPAVEEPTEFGSIVRAKSDKLFVLADATNDDDMRWCGQDGLWQRFETLGAIEVLRVGIG